jgi:transcriptional regulator of acetoin/glycerol metabolism
LERAHQAAIAAALQRTGGNVTAAAALLGMGRSTLYRKLGR